MHICLPMPATHYRVNIAPWQLYISTGSHRQRLFSDTSRLVLPHAVYRPAASYTYNLFPDRSEQAVPTVYRPEDWHTYPPFAGRSRQVLPTAEKTLGGWGQGPHNMKGTHQNLTAQHIQISTQLQILFVADRRPRWGCASVEKGNVLPQRINTHEMPHASSKLTNSFPYHCAMCNFSISNKFIYNMYSGCHHSWHCVQYIIIVFHCVSLCLWYYFI